jgi:hypothetical protein
MKKYLAALVGLYLIFALAGVSMATSFELIQNTDFSFYDATGHRTNTWTFNLPSAVNSANLYIDITDDGWDFLGNWAREYANLFVDGTQLWTSLEVNDQIYPFILTAQQTSDNVLLVKIDWVAGDFGVNFVKITGDYTASVPEPATMLLLGLGLVGLAGFGRKKFNS